MERNVANLVIDPSPHSPVLESFYHVSFAYQSEREKSSALRNIHSLLTEQKALPRKFPLV